ncbi:MAG TPA: hypothetical protein VGF89_01815 [Steroidobacteraceae bacterium]|jgi:hypothetical protein
MNDTRTPSNPPLPDPLLKQPERDGTMTGAQSAPSAAEESADETGNRALHKVASGPNPHVERHEPSPEAGSDKSPAGRW